VPNILLAQHKIGLKNILFRDLFTSFHQQQVPFTKASTKTPVTKTLLGEVHKLLRLYLTLPVTFSTSQYTFPALLRLKTLLTRTMKKDHLNNCLLLYHHKPITNTSNTEDTGNIAKKFVCAYNQNKRNFGKYELQVCAWLNAEPLFPMF